MATELKPCPLCGKKDNEALNWDGIWSVVCSDNDHHVEVTAALEEDAIAAWNTRPGESDAPNLVAERDRLRELCRRWNKAAALAGAAGSEFIDDPECVFALHSDLRKQAVDANVKANRLRGVVRDLVEALDTAWPHENLNTALAAARKEMGQ